MGFQPSERRHLHKVATQGATYNSVPMPTDQPREVGMIGFIISPSYQGCCNKQKKLNISHSKMLVTFGSFGLMLESSATMLLLPTVKLRIWNQLLYL